MAEIPINSCNQFHTISCTVIHASIYELHSVKAGFWSLSLTTNKKACIHTLSWRIERMRTVDTHPVPSWCHRSVQGVCLFVEQSRGCVIFMRNIFKLLLVICCCFCSPVNLLFISHVFVPQGSHAFTYHMPAFYPIQVHLNLYWSFIKLFNGIKKIPRVQYFLIKTMTFLYTHCNICPYLGACALTRASWWWFKGTCITLSEVISLVVRAGKIKVGYIRRFIFFHDVES